MQNSLKIIIAILLQLVAIGGYAQKLPSVQQAGVWTPANIKIDGKATEWDDTFQAYNHATDLFYTVANNNDFFYLIIHAEDPLVIETLTTYGFKFTIQTQEKKDSNKDIVSIQFPLWESKRLGLTLYKTGGERDTVMSVENGIMNTNNNVLQQRHKTLIIRGIEGLDTLSVYNETGVRIAETFNNKREYTLELAVPIRYIKLLKNDIPKLSYHLVIVGFGGSPLATMEANIPKDGLNPEQLQGIAAMELRLNKKYASTDFSGEYTFAKKP